MTSDELHKLLEDIGVNQIRQGNGNFRALCPFHDERTPSWGISYEEPHFHGCFACHAAGTLYTLLLRIGGYSPEKAKKFCRITEIGTQFKQVTFTRIRPKTVLPEIDESELYAFDFGAPAKTYLKNRGISPSLAENAGCVFHSEDQRILFPWYVEDALVAVTGRTILEDEEAKTLPYFGSTKSSVLYLPSQRIVSGLFVLVEGELDAINVSSVHSNVGAVGHGRITSGQMQFLIESPASEVMVFSDDDETGELIYRKVSESLKGKKKVSRPNYTLFGKFARKNMKLDPGGMTEKGITQMIENRIRYADWPTF